MESRLEQYKHFHNVASSTNGRDRQAKRRQDALDRQRQERKQAFSLTRDGLDAIIDDLDLSSDDDEKSHHDAEVPDLDQVNAGGQIQQTGDGKTASSVTKRIKKKWKAYADRLMQGETLDLSEGLPEDLDSEWLALGPVPAGKRCLVVTFPSSRVGRNGRVSNALLLSRVSGRPLSRHFIPALPPDCVLDTIYVAEKGVLFVSDVLRWKSQSMVECEAEFRMFWRDSKLSELPAQTLPSLPVPNSDPAPEVDMTPEGGDTQAQAKRYRRPKKASHLIVLPIPCLSAPLNLRQLSDDLLGPSYQDQRARINFPAQTRDPASQRVEIRMVSVEYEVDGCILLIKSACYESGVTPLAAWVPQSDFKSLTQMLLSHR